MIAQVPTSIIVAMTLVAMGVTGLVSAWSWAFEQDRLRREKDQRIAKARRYKREEFQ